MSALPQLPPPATEIGAARSVSSSSVSKTVNQGGKAPAPSNVVNRSEVKTDAMNLVKDEKISKNGRAGKQKQLRKLMKDDKVSSADRGWLKQDANSISREKRTTLRVPIGKELAHKRGFEAAKGCDYSHTTLQGKDLHKLQHKYDGMGKKNKNKTLPEAPDSSKGW